MRATGEGGGGVRNPERACDHEVLEIRVHGSANSPTLVYLPGLHGDWTLAGALRHALATRVRFVEFAYPRSIRWGLDDYAGAVESALLSRGIREGWVLAESFGSQVAWPLCGRSREFKAQGLILAGGFGRHPMPCLARVCARLMEKLPFGWYVQGFRVYRWVSSWRFRNAPNLASDLEEFVRRRTRADRAAMVHRLDLIAANDPTSWASCIAVPVHSLTGFWDPVVPWPWVRSWLASNCPTYHGCRCVGGADHNVLATGTARSTDAILRWMSIATDASRD